MTSAIMLGKQWKAETETVKMQFRNMAEDLKRKHTEEHPDYHYTPRKPSEKKRRAPSRHHAKPAQQLPTPSDTTSSTPGIHDAAIPTTTSPPTAAVASTSESPTGLETLDFDTDIFGQLVQQVQGEFNFGESAFAFGVPSGEPFEFSDYVTDCY